MDIRVKTILNGSKIFWTTSVRKFLNKVGPEVSFPDDIIAGYAGPDNCPKAKTEGIYLSSKDIIDFVILHELAHATGFRVGRSTTSNPAAEEALANAVAERICIKFGLPIPTEVFGYAAYPPSSANPREVDTAYYYILNNWAVDLEMAGVA